MTIYFSAEKVACYPDDLRGDYELAGTWPADAEAITDEEFDRFFLNPPAPGFKLGVKAGRPAWVVDAEYAASMERSWIEGELKRVADEIDKAQDSDPTATGTEVQWRTYRIALRAWPENGNFPNKDLRPMAPDE